MQSQPWPRSQRTTSTENALRTIADRLRGATPLSASYPPVSRKHAAVLIPLFEDAEGVVRVVLCRRTKTLSTHGGEVALPGGKRDESDVDDVHTALREAEEELGIKVVEVLGKLKPVLSKHFLSVVPIIGMIPASAILRPNAAEVEAVFDVPLHTFLSADPAIYSYRDTTMSFGEEVMYRLHFFQQGEYCIWGLTAGILISAAQLALGKDPEFQVMPGDRDYFDIVYDHINNTVRYRRQPSGEQQESMSCIPMSPRYSSSDSKLD